MTEKTLNGVQAPQDPSDDAEFDTFDTLDDAADAFETPETDEDENADSPSENQADDTGDAEDDADPDAAMITLDDGAEVSVADLKKGYADMEDHSRRVADLARDRADVEASWNEYMNQAEALRTMYGEIARVAQSVIPPEPDMRLLHEDPRAYETQLTAHRQAMAELEQVYAARDSVAGTADAASEAQLARYKADQDARLLAALPGLGNADRRAKFDTAVQRTAQDFGFSEEEISTTFDHRIRLLVHYAGLGKIAERNRKKATRSAGKPQPGRRPQPAPAKKPVNRNAMKRLVQSGSIEDALRVDFD